MQRTRRLIEQRGAPEVEREAVERAAHPAMHQEPRGLAGGRALVTLAGGEPQHGEPYASGRAANRDA